VDFGEAAEERFFVIAEVEAGKDTRVEWRELKGTRPFIDCRARLGSGENVNETLLAALPSQKKMQDAIIRLVVEYPREMDALIDEAALRKYAEKSFEFHFVKRPQIETRVRLPEDQTVSSLSPLELLDVYWRAAKIEEAESLQSLAREIITGDEGASHVT
jgi:exonuclease SbcD